MSSTAQQQAPTRWDEPIEAWSERWPTVHPATTTVLVSGERLVMFNHASRDHTTIYDPERYAGYDPENLRWLCGGYTYWRVRNVPSPVAAEQQPTPHQPLLTWDRDIDEGWYASSAICASEDGDNFVYRIDASDDGTFVFRRSSAELHMPDDEGWDTLAAAKAACEEHEREVLRPAARSSPTPVVETPAASVAPDNPAEQAEERLTIDEWAAREGIYIADPDGFDRADAELWTRTFSHAEYVAGKLHSTIGPRSHLKPAAPAPSGGEGQRVAEPMPNPKGVDLLERLVEYAKKYRCDASASIARNRHMNEICGAAVGQPVVDAVLTDFINAIGVRHGIDYALYTKDLVRK